jgi:hypothetical protein
MMATHVRSFGLCGELITHNDSSQSFCALTPNHPGRHGEANNNQDSDEDLWSLVDGLVTRIAELEARIAPLERAISMFTPKATLPIVAGADTIMGLRYASHSRFIPAYDSEGTY